MPLQAKSHFAPELLNRLDGLLVFNPLSKENLSKICVQQIQTVQERLISRGIKLCMDHGASKCIVEQSYDAAYGARPLNRYVEQNVVTTLAQKIINGEVTDNCRVRITTNAMGCELHYDVSNGTLNAKL